MRKELIERLRAYASTSLAPALMAQAADMLEADAQQSDQITGLQVAIRNLTEQPAAPQEPYELDQCDVERAKRCLEALRVVLGIDSPETRGWAPIVQQEARRAIDRALAALVEQTAQIQRLKSSVPQEPVAWQYRGRPAVNREWGEWHTVGHKPKGPECTRFMMRPLYTAPQQQPRLTDEEIHELLVSEIYPNFAAMVRAVEKKVRGEA